MIDTSVVCVHQHGACIAGNRAQQMGRSRGGLSTKIHAVVDGNGLPIRIGLTSGEAHDNRLCARLLAGLRPEALLLADRGYDADWIRRFVAQQGAAPFHFQIEAAWHHSVWGLEAVKAGVFAPPALVGPVPFVDLRAMIARAETAAGLSAVLGRAVEKASDGPHGLQEGQNAEVVE